MLNLTEWNNISYDEDPDVINFLLFSNILQLKCKEKSVYYNDTTSPR